MPVLRVAARRASGGQMAYGYGRLKRSDKATVLRFLERGSGYSRQRIARLVKRGGERQAMVKRYCGSRTSFAHTYTVADILLLAQAKCHGRQALHGAPIGSAARLAYAVRGMDSGKRWHRVQAFQ